MNLTETVLKSLNKEVKWWKIIWKGEQIIIIPDNISFKL